MGERINKFVESASLGVVIHLFARTPISVLPWDATNRGWRLPLFQKKQFQHDFNRPLYYF